LEQEGAVFDELHPDIKKPMMAVMLVDPHAKDHQGFSEKIVKSMGHYKDATIYLCASRRTKKRNYDQLMACLNQKVEEAGYKNRLDIVGHSFNADPSVYNPYKGLIARAKHFVVWGDSQSMVSEALYSGKLTYTYRTGVVRELIEKGYIHQFNDLDDSKAPLYNEFEPVNLTAQIAEKLLEKSEAFQKSAANTIQNKVWVDGKSWVEYLDKVRLNFNSAQDIPLEFIEKPRFLEAVLSLRGCALKYFPQVQNDKELVGHALAENKHAALYLGDELCEDHGFIKEKLNEDSTLYHSLPKKVQDNLDIAKHALIADFKQHKDIIRHMSQSVIAQLDDFFTSELYQSQLLLVLGYSSILYRYQPKVIKDNHELAMKALDVNSRVYHELTEEFKLDLNLIETALSRCKVDGNNISSSLSDDAVKKIKGASIYRDYLLSMLQGDSSFYKSLPRQYRLDPNFVLDALNGGGGIYRKLPKEMKRNLKVAKKALLKDLRSEYDVFVDVPRATLEALSPILKSAKYKNYLARRLRISPDQYKCLPQALKYDKKFALKAVGSSTGSVYQYLPLQMRSDIDVAKKSLLCANYECVNVLEHIPNNILRDLEPTLLSKKYQDNIISALFDGGVSLHDIPDCLQRSSQFCLKLLKRDVNMYRSFTSEMKLNKVNVRNALLVSLKDDPYVSIKILNAVPKSIVTEVIGSLKKSELLGLMKTGADIYQYLPQGYKLTTRSALKILNETVSAYKYFPEETRQNIAVAKCALEGLDECSEGLMAALPDVTALALKDVLLSAKYQSELMSILYSTPSIYQELPAMLKCDPRFALQVLDRDTDIYKFFPDEIKLDPRVTKKALIKDIKKNQGVIGSIPEQLRQDKKFLKEVRLTNFKICKNQAFKDAYKKVGCAASVEEPPKFALSRLSVSCSPVFNAKVQHSDLYVTRTQQNAVPAELLVAVPSIIKPAYAVT
jgi:hypothetical protein